MSYTPCQSAWLWTGNTGNYNLEDAGNYTLISGAAGAGSLPVEGDIVIEAVAPIGVPGYGISPAAWVLDTEGTNPGIGGGGAAGSVPTFNGPVLMSPQGGGSAIGAGVFNAAVTLGSGTLLQGVTDADAEDNAQLVFNGPVIVPADATGVGVDSATFNGPLVINASLSMASTVALNCPAIFFATQDLYNDFLAGGYTYTGPVFVAGVLANTGSDWSDPGSANVLSGVEYYAGGTQETGTLILPPASQVLAGTPYGVGGSGSTGTLVGGFVDSVGSITIIRNCDHKAADGTAWSFTDPGTWPSLSGASATLSIRQIGNNSDPAPLILTASVAAGPPQVLTFEATHTQTAALTPSANPDDYTFDIVAVLASGDRASLMSEGYATVVCNVTGTGLPSGQPTPVSLNAGSQW